jgi:hypothetical protein
VEWRTVSGLTRLLARDGILARAFFRVPFDHGIDAETGYRMATTIQKTRSAGALRTAVTVAIRFEDLVWF